MENSGTMAYIGKSSNDALTEVSANGICDLRRDVAKSEADIKEALGNGFCTTLKSIGDSECAIIKNDNDIAHRNTIHLNSVERDLQNQILTNRAILLKDIGDKAERTNDRVDAFERMASEKFCDVKSEVKDSERRILDRLTADKLDEKNEIIDALRHERYADRHAHQFALQNQELAYLKQMFNSFEYNQKVSSSIKQFGVGNSAIPVQTSNNG